MARVELSDPASLYWTARRRGLRPVMLESLGPRTDFGRRTVCACVPARRLEVWDGLLYEDGAVIGVAADLFAELETGLGEGFFPLWAGFFAYEFARHLGLPTGTPLPGLPEAAFSLYTDGYLWQDGQAVTVPKQPLANTALAPPAAVVPSVTLVSDFPCEEFIAGVDAVQERIRAGWVYQVNLSHRFHFSAAGVDPLACYRRLRVVNPSPFMGLIEGDDWAVVSGSPERLFTSRQGVLSARPIAGTRPRGASEAEDGRLEAELRASVKEQAEHVMLVDLLRNDLSRVCVPGSVEVTEAFTVERYSHVMHLVSEVRGLVPGDPGDRLGGDRLGSSRAAAPPSPRLADMVAAIFPGGTITGAPKESVMREIARLEPVARGAYTGSLGYISGTGVDFNILIRSLTFAGGVGYISAGGGIVIGSEATEEYLETRHKAEALLHVLGSGKPGQACSAPRRQHAWRPPAAPRQFTADVVFLEAHDSFSYNIVNYLRMLGATVRVIDVGTTPESANGDMQASDSADRSLANNVLPTGATHLVAGPGPGDPASAGHLLAWVKAALSAGIPFLGICLGHQALGVALGAHLERAPRPVHGEDHRIYHFGDGLFAGIPSPARFTRYHSLHLTMLPAMLEQQAWTEDGLTMAIAHRQLPAWGVQFHPESMLSPHGLILLANFLALSRA